MIRKYIKRALLYIINITLGLLIISPVIYALLISLMKADQIFQYPPSLLPKSLYFENYKEAIKSVPIIRFIMNSLLVSSSVTIGQVITASFAAYSFSFFEFKGKNFLFIAILATLMIPGESTIIANYLTVGSWGWLDSYKVLIVPYLTSAMGVFLMRQYFLTLPKDLYEAAVIDGCGNLKFFINILLPLSKPAVGALGVYTFLNTWNQYMWPLLVTNKAKMRTVQIGISMLQFAEAQSFGMVMSGIVLILIPSILIFIVGQKQLIEGITSGAVKG